MVKSIQEMESFAGVMIGKERVDGELKFSHSDMIISFHPRQLYAQSFNENGEKGPEILYRTGQNDNKVLVSPDGFPYVNVSLSPFSMFMRKGRHNTIHEAGGTYLGQVIHTMLTQNDSSRLAETVRYDSLIEFNGHACYKVIVENNEYDYVIHTLKKDETIRDVAMMWNVSEYKLVECNDNVDDFDDAEPGKTIRIPNSYAKQTVLYLDVNHFMPWLMINYDDKGLYSEYEYTSITLNPTITDQTFNPDNPAYGF